MLNTERISITTFNLNNYLAPPNAFYDFEQIYTRAQWQQKQGWICNYLKTHQPDIIGFQEVFSIDELRELGQSA